MGTAGKSSAVGEVGAATGLMGVEGTISMVGTREELSTSPLLVEKYSSLLGSGMMSMTMLEAWMEDLEGDEGCRDRDGGTFTRRWTILPFTCVFAKSPMPFRKGTERLVKKVPKGLPLHFRERVSCHFGWRSSFGGASGNEETERDMGWAWERMRRRQIYAKLDQG